MWLTNREQEKLMIYTAAKLAAERKERGIKLNFPEATAVISFFILEGAKDGKSVADLMVEAKSLLKEDDVMEGVTEMIETVQVEATFDDGTKLVTIHQPISKNPPSDNSNQKTSLIPGEYLIDSGELDLNSAAGDSIKIEVENQGDRPVQVGSHYHFFEVNRFLSFPRENAYGKRLDIPSGTSIRFEPGSKKSINLIDYTGARYVSGFNGLVEGNLDDEAVKKNAMERLNQFLGELK